MASSKIATAAAASNSKKKNGKKLAVPSTKNAKKIAIPSSISGGASPAAEEHLPPLPLVFFVLFCSGFLLIFGLRDFMMTGRNIFGDMDESLMMFTKSKSWYDDAKGWKSTQGGFSAVMTATTDQNNMGGFFVRKVAGAAVAGVQMQKIIPLLFHQRGAKYSMGHFQPLLVTSILANLASMTFLACKWDDLSAASGANELPFYWIAVMAVESVVLLYYALTAKTKRGPAVAMKDGKTPSSSPSRILSRTVWIVTSFTAAFAIRDLFFPGVIMEWIPLDDIYLEWTNAFRHSPPEGSPEAMDHGLEAPLFAGDKFISQYAALHVLLCSLFKMYSAGGIRYGADGRGEIQAKMFWTVQLIANSMYLFVFRLFASAATTASLDLRYYLMVLAYETFILALFALF
mmetsp:Transcript_12215/g.15972  ORF Transcript_12215/g.15972 Transcript_12215/m.15972 type:complete len:401 (+) Transcript_12215:110-1312(+)